MSRRPHPPTSLAGHADVHGAHECLARVRVFTSVLSNMVGGVTVLRFVHEINAAVEKGVFLLK